MSVEYLRDLIGVKALLLGSAKMKFKAPLTPLIDKLQEQFTEVESDEKEWAKTFDTFQGFLFETKYDHKKPKDLLKGYLKEEMAIDRPEDSFNIKLRNRLKNNMKNRLNDRLKDVLRFSLGKYSFVIKGIKETKYAEVFLFIYPSMEIVNIFTNIEFGNISTEEMIYARKIIQFNKDSVNFNVKKFFKDSSSSLEKMTFTELNNKIYQSILKLSWSYKYSIKHYFFNLDNTYCQKVVAKLQIKNKMLLEVQGINGLPDPFLSFDKIEKHYAQKFYGLLQCDEGFNFVPRQVALNGLKDSFSSREHFRIYPSSNGVLMVNLIKTKIQQKYEKMQFDTANHFDDTSAKIMFKEHPPIAGLENGALQAMERATILSVIIQKDLSNMNNSINSIISNGKDMISTINILANFKNLTIEPMSELTESIIDKFGINKGNAIIREKLDIAKDDNLLIRQRRSTTLLIFIAVITLVVCYFSAKDPIDRFLETPHIPFISSNLQSTPASSK